MYARIATFEGGDVQELKRINDERMAAGTMSPPEGMKRALVLEGGPGGRRLFISFFDDREAIERAEARFESMGDEIPEHVRGRRLSVDVYEVAFEGEM